jgi:hypothetical protein
MRPMFAEIAEEIFDFYLDDSSTLEFTLREFGRQPEMRDVVMNYITGKL